MKRYFVYLLIIQITFSFLCKINQSAQEEKQGFNSSLDANYRLIDVVVLDENDEHIVGLNKSNFRIWQNDVEQEILSLYEINYLETDEISPLEIKPQFYIENKQRLLRFKGQPIWHAIMIANVPNNSSMLDKLEDGIRDFIDDNLKPHDRIGIFLLTKDGIMKMIDFTEDKENLLKTVNWLFQNRKILTPEMAFLYPMTRIDMLRYLNSFIFELRYLEGRKSIMLLTAGLPNFNPTIGGLFYYNGNFKKVRDEDIPRLALNLSNTNTSLDVIDLSSHSIMGNENEFSGSGALKKDSSDANDIINYYKKANDLGTEISPKIRSSDDERLRFFRFIVNFSGGDVFLHSLSSSSRLRKEMEKVYNRNSHYYILGYIPRNIETVHENESKTQRLKVEVLNKKVSRVIYKKYVEAPIK